MGAPLAEDLSGKRTALTSASLGEVPGVRGGREGRGGLLLSDSFRRLLEASVGANGGSFSAEEEPPGDR
jgi:hypothetical protein